MAVYDFSQLTKLWAQDKITTEQAVGQLMLHLSDLAERVSRLERAQKSVAARELPGKPKLTDA